MAAIPPTGFRHIPLPLAQLSLHDTLNCGQSFRWTSFRVSKEPALLAHEYRLCLRDRVVCLRQSPETLFYRSIFPGDALDRAQADAREDETLAWLKDYFQLDVDLVKLYDEWSERDPVFRNIRDRFPGIRILRQDPWENLVSFICSSNNNIIRITKMVHALCMHFSPPLLSVELPAYSEDGITKDVTYHAFPPPSILVAPEVAAKLRSLRFGYRADYIQRTAKMLVDEHGAPTTDSDVQLAPEKWLATLRNLETSEAREELLRFVGVGRKVADCILLMSLDKRQVVPVDTHVHQIATKHYGFKSPGSSKKVSMTPKLYDEINRKLADTWGEYAGWAHSVLFAADLKFLGSVFGKTASSSTSREITPSSTPTATPTSKRTRETHVDTSRAERAKRRRGE